jgi:nicotinate phosphoribosyltransferase
MPYSQRPEWYREKLSEQSVLWGDLYAATMGQALFTNNMHNINATFEAFVRKMPFGGSYLMSAGQGITGEWMDKHWQFKQRSLDVLRGKEATNPMTGAMEAVFSNEYLNMCQDARLQVSIDALDEGDLAFEDEPIYRVRGPAWQGLMLETGLLNATNSQSLFATLASRLKTATNSDYLVMSPRAQETLLLEFGLRRAQCIGGLEPTRGAYIGGADGTSNMQAEELYGIWSVGTFAHALVMLHEDELEAFANYAKAMPNNGIFLVDTYNTLEGVKKAIKACKDAGVAMKGIRLDSGDLAYLSIEARKLLDEAGFNDAKIAASNDLDEQKILDLQRLGAKIDIWALGTNLVTSSAQPALGAVFKLVSVYNDPRLTMNLIEQYQRDAQAGNVSPWKLQEHIRNVIKLGERPPPGEIEKASLPGEHLILRTLFQGKAGWRYNGDIIYPVMKELPVKRSLAPQGPYEGTLTAPVISVNKNTGQEKVFPVGTPVILPMHEMFNRGGLTGMIGTVHTARENARQKLSLLDPEHRRIVNPRPYGVGLEKSLYEERRAMIADLRGPD